MGCGERRGEQQIDVAALIVGASPSERAELLQRLAELGLEESEVAEAATPLDAISLLLEYPEIRVVLGDPELSGALAEEFPTIQWPVPPNRPAAF